LSNWLVPSIYIRVYQYYIYKREYPRTLEKWLLLLYIYIRKSINHYYIYIDSIYIIYRDYTTNTYAHLLLSTCKYLVRGGYQPIRRYCTTVYIGIVQPIYILPIHHYHSTYIKELLHLPPLDKLMSTYTLIKASVKSTPATSTIIKVIKECVTLYLYIRRSIPTLLIYRE
jgi:hypothetical protein